MDEEEDELAAEDEMGMRYDCDAECECILGACCTAVLNAALALHGVVRGTRELSALNKGGALDRPHEQLSPCRTLGAR